jgi:hypothetical protein
MKGIVFREFADMVEQTFSAEILNRIIDASNLATRGAYTAVGTYDHREIVELVNRLSSETGVGIPDLLRAFGRYLFKRFVALYPHFFASAKSAFDFLPQVHNIIHVEVKKLYPDAELPQFETSAPEPDRFVMVYRSTRPFGDLAEGLILGCIEHFGEKISLAREDLPCQNGAHIRFTLIRQK